MTLWIFNTATSQLWKCSGEPWSTCVSICTLQWGRKGRKYDFGWTSLWWITDVHFNLFTSFWFSSLSALLRPQITGDDWQIKTVRVKWLLFPYLFIFHRCNAMPKRKLRFQTVQSEFQMRCNSMENIKCQSQFCPVRREGFSTLGWLAHARVWLRLRWGITLFFSCPFFFSFSGKKKRKKTHTHKPKCKQLHISQLPANCYFSFDFE